MTVFGEFNTKADAELAGRIIEKLMPGTTTQVGIVHQMDGPDEYNLWIQKTEERRFTNAEDARSALALIRASGGTAELVGQAIKVVVS